MFPIQPVTPAEYLQYIEGLEKKIKRRLLAGKTQEAINDLKFLIAELRKLNFHEKADLLDMTLNQMLMEETTADLPPTPTAPPRRARPPTGFHQAIPRSGNSPPGFNPAALRAANPNPAPLPAAPPRANPPAAFPPAAPHSMPPPAAFPPAAPPSMPPPAAFPPAAPPSMPPTTPTPTPPSSPPPASEEPLFGSDELKKSLTALKDLLSKK